MGRGKATVSDRFDSVLGTRRGATRAHDDTEENEKLRKRASVISGHTMSLNDHDKGPMTVKPLCKTGLYMGMRRGFGGSWEAQGELHYVPEEDCWAASITSGPWDSKWPYCVATSPRLEEVLEKLQEELDYVVGGERPDGTHEGRLSPTEPGPQHITVDDLIERLEYVERLQYITPEA